MDQNEFQLHVVETLTRLDTKMDGLVGNGKPGRVGKLEEDVEALKKWRWTAGGIVTGVATAISTAMHYLLKH